MNWQLVRKIVRIIGSFVGLCIFLYLVFDGLKKLAGTSTTIDISWKHVALTLIFYLLTYFFQILNFKLIYASLHQTVSLLTTIIGYSFPFCQSIFPAMSGDTIPGLIGLRRRLKYPVDIPGRHQLSRCL